MPLQAGQREFLIDNLLVRIHFIIVMIGWTGLAPWEFEFPFPSSLTSNFLDKQVMSPVYFASPLRWDRALFHAKVDGFVPCTQHVNLRIARQPECGPLNSHYEER